MQERARTSAYVDNVSVAYDLSAFDVRNRKPAANKVLSIVNRRRRIAMLRSMVRGVVLCAFVVVMLGGILISSSQLTELTTEAASLKAKNEQLESEKKRLQALLDMNMDLKTVESRAVEELYMQRLEQDQIVYIDMTGEDHGKVVEDTRSVAAKVADGVKNVTLLVVDMLD